MSGKNNIIRFGTKIKKLKYIGLDSMCFLYQFTKHPLFSPFTKTIISSLEKNSVSAVTSMITVTEIFIHEEKIGDPFTLQIYEHTFKSLPNLSLIPIDWNIARFASKLRAKYGFLKTPGALQLSSSIIKGCRGFITNDEKLKKVKEIEVVVLKEFV